MNYESVEALVKQEQIDSGGSFITGVDIENYLNKIRLKAELVTHYVEGECAGFVAFYCNNPSKEDAFITLVLVSPFFRGRGISNILLSCVLDICKSRNFKTCTLEVKNNNLSAIRVYSNLGFLKVEENEEKTIMKIKLN